MITGGPSVEVVVAASVVVVASGAVVVVVLALVGAGLGLRFHASNSPV